MMDKLSKCATEVHERLGPGFTESVYHSALERELSEQGIPFHSEATIPVMYRGAPVGRRRPDLFVVTDYGLVVVELKAGSSSGSDQLEQYLGLTTDDDNLGQIVGGALIKFNNVLEYDYTGITDDSEDQT
jgi:GxxExxY protein